MTRHAEATAWMVKSARFCLPAKFNLAFRYLYGFGSEQKFKEGFLELRDTADAGNIPSYLPLATLFATGTGTNRSVANARYWIAKLESEGDFYAAMLNTYDDDTLTEKLVLQMMKDAPHIEYLPKGNELFANFLKNINFKPQLDKENQEEVCVKK